MPHDGVHRHLVARIAADRLEGVRSAQTFPRESAGAACHEEPKNPVLKGRSSVPHTSQTLTVTHRTGLLTRPCLDIVKLCRQFDAKVLIRRGDVAVNATEILGLLSLGATEGTELVVSAEGPQAEGAVEALAHLFNVEFRIHYNE